MRRRLAEYGLLGHVDSAGTSVRLDAVKPDPLAGGAAEARGLSLEPGRARPFEPDDFDRFDRIVVFDRGILEAVTRLARSEADRTRVSLEEIADPFAGDAAAYDRTYELIGAACERLVREVR